MPDLAKLQRLKVLLDSLYTLPTNIDPAAGIIGGALIQLIEMMVMEEAAK